MNSDLLLVVGVILGVLAVPAIVSAFTDGRPPRSAAILVMISATLIVLATYERPTGYRVNDVPDAFARVFGRYLN
jgi:hypothetical protein